MKKLSALLMVAILLLSCGCTKSSSKPQATQTLPQITSNGGENNMYPIATITMVSGDVITAELYPDKAPETVANFIYLANTKHFYDGLIFHRVIPDFVIQGGDPNGTGTGGPGYTIKGEFAANGVKTNDLKHTAGVLSMARSSSYDSAGSQFFICVAVCSNLDGQYAGFGKVISGMDVATKISLVARNSSDKPNVPQTIKSITVDTKGKEYAPPANAK